MVIEAKTKHVQKAEKEGKKREVAGGKRKRK